MSSTLQSTDFLEHGARLVLLSSTLLVSLLLATAAGKIIHNLFLHPLKSYPGPLLWRASRIPYNYHLYYGTLDRRSNELHHTYGHTVRVAPDQLLFTSSQAFHDFTAHHPGKQEFPKDPFSQQKTPNGIPSILGADKENHARYRRLMAHAFSVQGLKDQESHILKYANLMVDRLAETAKAGEFTDMVSWYNMTTFDIIGDLAFGDSFNSLLNRQLHDWVPAVAGSVRFVLTSGIWRRYGLDFLIPYMLPKSTIELRKKNLAYVGEKLEQRIQLGEDRGDFWDRIMIKSAHDNATGEGMSRGEMFNNASVLVLGGSETSATNLSGTTYLLLKHPEIMKRIINEVRSTFNADDEITIASVDKLPYMIAALQESMRLYAPAPNPGLRKVPKGGAMVDGNLLPEDTIVATNFHSMFHSELNFHKSDEFHPERWLHNPPSEFECDDKSAFQPFSVGTRNCIGRNLAYAETRLLLAKVLYHFDLELDEARTGDWFDQKGWGVWWKKPLWVSVRSANG